MRWDEYIKGTTKVKFFIEGLPRSGKTCLAASASKIGKTLYIDAEGGLVSARKFVNKDNIEIEKISTINSDVCLKQLEGAMIKAMSGKYEWIVLDSITEISGQLEDQYAKKEGGGSVKDWMTIVEKVKKIGRFLRDGDFHCIVTALLKGGDGNEPVLPGSTAIVLPSFYNTLSKIQVLKIGGAMRRTLVSDGLMAVSVGDRLNILDSTEPIDEQNPELILAKLVNGILSM
ncbi:MAG TPA: AAA family ATPase [Candidatus Hodarchaeales archaeon]|nr:AAA family ATPase [Candidatus Hodarchaeales archaeon]